MEKVSCVIITFNEETNILKCLQAVLWCDEIIIVDSGSTDRTLEICKDFNCKIYHKDFNGYGEQKRFAVSLTENNWVLNIDADEVVTIELKDEIEQELNNEKIDHSGFNIPRSLFFLGKRFKYGKESREYYLRLFNKDKGNFTKDKVHEKVLVDGITKKLNNVLLHYSYTSLHQYFEKFNNYTTTASQQFYEKGISKSLLLTIAALPLYFIKNYLIKGNVLNGVQGFLWALFSSWYPIVKYAKLWVLTKKNQSEN